MEKEKKSNRAERTTGKIWDAYLSLLQDKESDSITVKDVCAAARVNRSTYYAYYFNLEDLLAEKEAELDGKILSRLHNPSREKIGVRADLIAYLSFVKENAPTFYACFRNSNLKGFPPEMQKAIRRSIAFYYPACEKASEPVRSLILDFYEEGLYRVIRNWVLHGCVEPEEELISVIYGCMTGFSSEK